jgi:hypothetical protein
MPLMGKSFYVRRVSSRERSISYYVSVVTRISISYHSSLRVLVALLQGMGGPVNGAAL